MTSTTHRRGRARARNLSKVMSSPRTAGTRAKATRRPRHVAVSGQWSYSSLISAMNNIDELVARTEVYTFSTATEIDALCNKFLKLSINSASQDVSKPKTRLGWLLSCLPNLTVECNPSATGLTLTKFKLFMKLPAEIRIIIWDMIARQSRKVKLLECSVKPYQHSSIDWNSNVEGQSRHPAILQICSESRYEALGRHYTRCQDRRRYVAHSKSPTKIGTYMSNTFYINFNLDTFIHGSSQFDPKKKEFPTDDGFNFEPNVLRRIKHIEQQPCYRSAWPSYFQLWRETLSDALIFRTDVWKDLKEVIIVQNDFSPSWDIESLVFEKYCIEWESNSRAMFEAFPNFAGGGFSMFTSPLRKSLPPLSFTLKFKWNRSVSNGDKSVAGETKSYYRYPEDPVERAAALARYREVLVIVGERTRIEDQARLAEMVARHQHGSC